MAPYPRTPGWGDTERTFGLGPFTKDIQAGAESQFQIQPETEKTCQ